MPNVGLEILAGHDVSEARVAVGGVPIDSVNVGIPQGPIEPILLRNDTTEGWELSNPVLGLGEQGLELTIDGTIRMKIGTGYEDWNHLAYFGGGGSGGLPQTDLLEMYETAKNS